jgi:cyclopropane fatty-acyl-phospholipid synthase-like methyltransferase
MHPQIQPLSLPVNLLTSQRAPLERLLARLRTKKIFPYVVGKNVLDFGCGREAWNANEIRSVCASIIGVEKSFTSRVKLDTITIFPKLDDIVNSIYQPFDVVLALAVFEHIEPMSLRGILTRLHECTTPSGMIVATVPTPQARRILEVAAYRLHLIDRSQIDDHKVYYDDLWIKAITTDTGWYVASYQRFQLGLNSIFVLKKQSI